MTDLRSTMLESMNRFQPDLSPSAQAILTIPMGTVGQMRQLFEDRISRHHYQPNDIYFARALRNTDELIRQDRTYDEQLRIIETIGLHDLSPHLRSFLRDNDNLMRAITRSHRSNYALQTDQTVDIITRIAGRIEHLRHCYMQLIIRSTRSEAELSRMANDPRILAELHDCTDAVVDELCRDLVREFDIDRLSYGDVELENIGPDHDVNDFGSDVAHTDPAVTELQNIPPTALTVKDDNKIDHTQRCCICLDDFTSHQAIRISLCNHIIGKTCLSTWLHSTTTNAHQCPLCRTELCARRARQPAAHLDTERAAIVSRVHAELCVIDDIDTLANHIFGGGSSASVGAWSADVNRMMNRWFREEGVPLAWRRLGGTSVGWDLVVVDWGDG